MKEQVTALMALMGQKVSNAGQHSNQDDENILIDMVSRNLLEYKRVLGALSEFFNEDSTECLLIHMGISDAWNEMCNASDEFIEFEPHIATKLITMNLTARK